MRILNFSTASRDLRRGHPNMWRLLSRCVLYVFLVSASSADTNPTIAITSSVGASGTRTAQKFVTFTLNLSTPSDDFDCENGLSLTNCIVQSRQLGSGCLSNSKRSQDIFTKDLTTKDDTTLALILTCQVIDGATTGVVVPANTFHSSSSGLGNDRAEFQIISGENFSKKNKTDYRLCCVVLCCLCCLLFVGGPDLFTSSKFPVAWCSLRNCFTIFLFSKIYFLSTKSKASTELLTILESKTTNFRASIQFLFFLLFYFNSDQSGPVITISSVATSPTRTSTNTFILTFSEHVPSFDSSALSFFAGTTGAILGTPTLSQDGLSVTVAVTNSLSQGAYSLGLVSGAVIADDLGNAANISTVSRFSVTVGT
jgi:methionine-rich copper-binding protein CopC